MLGIYFFIPWALTLPSCPMGRLPSFHFVFPPKARGLKVSEAGRRKAQRYPGKSCSYSNGEPMALQVLFQNRCREWHVESRVGSIRKNEMNDNVTRRTLQPYFPRLALSNISRSFVVRLCIPSRWTFSRISSMRTALRSVLFFRFDRSRRAGN